MLIPIHDDMVGRYKGLCHGWSDKNVSDLSFFLVLFEISKLIFSFLIKLYTIMLSGTTVHFYQTFNQTTILVAGYFSSKTIM